MGWMRVAILIGVCVGTTLTQVVPSVRLHGGTEKVGRLQIKHPEDDTRWRDVCVNSFENKYADLVCRELGYDVGGSFWHYPIKSEKIVTVGPCEAESLVSLSACNVSTEVGSDVMACERCHGVGIACGHNLRLSKIDAESDNDAFKTVLQVYLKDKWRALCYNKKILKNQALGDVLCKSLGQKEFVVWNKAFSNPDVFTKNYNGEKAVLDQVYEDCGKNNEEDIKLCNPRYRAVDKSNECVPLQILCNDQTYSDLTAEILEEPEEPAMCEIPELLENTTFESDESGSLHHVCYDLLSGHTVSRKTVRYDGKRKGHIDSTEYDTTLTPYRDCRWVLDFSNIPYGTKRTRMLEIQKLIVNIPVASSGTRLEIRDSVCLYTNTTCGPPQAVWTKSGVTTLLRTGTKPNHVVSVRFVIYPLPEGEPVDDVFGTVQGFHLRWKYVHTPEYLSDQIFHSPMMPVYVAALAIIVVFPIGCIVYCIACRGKGTDREKERREDEEAVKPQQLHDAVGSDSELDKL